jgi:hypothetical protein
MAELTVESLAKVVANKGLAEAAKAMESRKAALQVRIDDGKAAEKEMSQIQTILIGAVKMASKEAGIMLFASAVATPGGGRGRKTAADKDAFLAAVKPVVEKAGTDGLTWREIQKAAPGIESPTGATRSKWLEEAFTGKGEKGSKRYSAK